MNYLPSSPNRQRQQKRLEPRIIDSREDALDHYHRHRRHDGSDGEYDYYYDINDETSPCFYDVSDIEEARRVESILGSALGLAERNSGSLLCFNNVESKSSAVQLGRRISSIRSIEGMANLEDSYSYSLPTGGSNSFSFDSDKSLPTFLPVEMGDPFILAQKSWESLFSYDDRDAVNSSDSKRSTSSSTSSSSSSSSSSNLKVGGDVNKNKQPPPRRQKGKRDQGVQRPKVAAEELSIEIALRGKKTQSGFLGRRGKTAPAVRTTTTKTTKSPQNEEQVQPDPIVKVKDMKSVVGSIDDDIIDKTREVPLDVPCVDDDHVDSVEKTIPKRKKGWRWTKIGTKRTDAPTGIETREVPAKLESKGREDPEPDLPQEPTESPPLNQVDDNDDDVPDPTQDCMERTTANQLTMEEAQSMECVWLSTSF